jgi:beta-glucoside operon transcriptional antiterminator
MRMKIKKVLNNNVVTIIDDQSGLEKVIMGRGIAFQKRSGEMLDENRIEKTFVIQNQDVNQNFQKLIKDIPIAYMEVVEQIISHGNRVLSRELDEHLYITLTDHIAFAMQRMNKGIEVKNSLLWEIKRLYKKEYAVGLWALDLIREKLGVEFKEDEAGYIALHIVNASMNENMMNTVDITEMIQTMLNLIKYHFKMELPEDSLSFDRLVTHLTFFGQRVIAKKELKDEQSPFYDLIKASYKEVFDCVVKIKDFIEKNYDFQLSKAEFVYLSMHIQRIVSQRSL